MSLFKFISNLSPNMEVKRITDAIQNMRKTVDKDAIPALESIVSVFNSEYVYKSKSVAALNKRIISDVDAKKIDYVLTKPTSFDLILTSMKALSINLGIIEDAAISIFKGKTISSAGLSYNKGNIIQYVEAADFFVRYVRSYYNYATSLELSELSGIPKPEGVGPDDLELLTKRIASFTMLVEVLGANAKNTRDTFKKISNITIVEDEASVQSVMGIRATNPWGFGSLSWPMSAILRYNMSEAIDVVDDYRAAQAEARAVEYRVLLIQERINSGHGDASLESKLDTYNDRIYVQKQKMQELEEKYGIS